MKRFFALITVCLVIVLSACSKEVTDTIQESDSYTTASSESIGEETMQEIGEEGAQEIAFSWYKKNHYEFQPNKEDKYTFWFMENHEDIYGEESYLLVMFFEGKHCMDLAVTMQTGKLYLYYGVNVFVPIDNIKILDYTKEESEAKSLIKKLEKNLNETDLAYCDTIQREDETYFVYGRFKSATLESIYVMNVTTEETFEWELDKDTFKENPEPKSEETDLMYGKWKILNMVGEGYIYGEFSMGDYVGGVVTIDKNYMECDLPMGKFRLENPEYELTTQSENEFLEGTKVTVDNIFGFKPDKIQMVEMSYDSYDYNDGIWEGFELFWIRDETHLIFYGPVYFLAEKVE